MRVTSKGQITIPQNLRNRFGFFPNTEVEFIEQKGRVVLRKKKKAKARMEEWIRKAKGTAETNLTTDQIMQMTRGE